MGAEVNGEAVWPGIFHVCFTIGHRAFEAHFADLGDRLEFAGLGEMLFTLDQNGHGEIQE